MWKFCSNICMARLLTLLVIFCFLAPVAPTRAYCSGIVKTPDDVFRRVEDLKRMVVSLRAEQKISEAWPDVGKQTGKEPRHVYQKSLEVLGKIARLRRVKKMGPITVPNYPSREITPDEVYDLVNRLALEMNVFEPQTTGRSNVAVKGKTPSDVYKILWEVSKALDLLIGIRGLRPTDVYALSRQVVDMASFLRLTQNIGQPPQKPKRTKGKHPNHALMATITLVKKIALAEKNLWMEPISVPKPPKRTVAPEEVYDMLLLVVAELRRIQYRIGVERYFPVIQVEGTKSPDDVIYNINRAITLIPEFSKAVPLVQADPKVLEKTPNDVYAVAEHISENLIKYRRYRGIRTVPRQVPPQANMKPRHVYTKTVECLEKASRLRKQVGLGDIALPGHPLRKISPAEVYQQAVRLDEELAIVYRNTGMKSVSFLQETTGVIYKNKTPSDVFTKMWEISYLLDTIVGQEGYKPADVYRQAKRIVKIVVLLRQHLGETGKVSLPAIRKNVIPADVLKKSDETTSLLNRVKRRAGIFERAVPRSYPVGEITPDDVFNKMGLILSDLITLQIHFGAVRDFSTPEPMYGEKKPSDVYQQIEYTNDLLLDMLTK